MAKQTNSMENAMGVVRRVTVGLIAGRMRQIRTNIQHGLRSPMRLDWYPTVVATTIPVEQSSCLRPSRLKM
eukprot:9460144-Ditylum_brightwellii.AAC.1